MQLRLMAIVPRVAFDPSFSTWPHSQFCELRVLFPDIGTRPVVHQVGFLAREGEPLPSSYRSAHQVVEHLEGLATIL